MARNTLYTLAAGLTVALCWASGSVQAACEAAEHRQFDFWLGEWAVYAADGRLAGHNSIRSDYGGCVIHERYTTPSGRYAGQSLNSYDASRGLWHQSWVDSTGLLLLLDGRFVDGQMQLQGHTRSAEGVVTQQRISWTAQPDGSVRQVWEQQAPGADWVVVFDGRYVRQQASRTRKGPRSTAP